MPKYAEEKRDFAFVVDKNITCAQIENGIKGACDYVTDVTLFDVYEGDQIEKGYKSVAYSLTFRAKVRTLEDAEVSKIVEKILDELKKLGVELRA